MDLIDIDVCNEEEVAHVRKLIDEFASAFGLEGEPLQATHLITHRIEVTDNKPIRARRYRYPPHSGRFFTFCLKIVELLIEMS